MSKIKVSRAINIPDPVRISRYQKSPELGPKLLFFTGGSAFNGACKVLKHYTHNSIHLITPFDSGGSSAKIRDAFEMPAVGDLRNRLMALADDTVSGHPDVYTLLNHRFANDLTAMELRSQLAELVTGKSSLIRDITSPLQRLICNQLAYFQQAMPDDFDLRGASIGNLVLAGGYLNNYQHLDPILFLFSKLANVQGTVRATVDQNLHLAARLKDGRYLFGQHELTGKEVAPLTSAIEELFFCSDAIFSGSKEFTPTTAHIDPKNQELIASADLICYPPGSFYTSLLANLMPAGVGTAIANNDCPKVYIPNLGHDPEQLDMSLDETVIKLLQPLSADTGCSGEQQRFIDFILLDQEQGDYLSKPTEALLNSLGIKIIDVELVSRKSAPYYDDTRLVQALLSLT